VSPARPAPHPLPVARAAAWVRGALPPKVPRGTEPPSTGASAGFAGSRGPRCDGRQPP
jgi:hypothetical protein